MRALNIRNIGLAVMLAALVPFIAMGQEPKESTAEWMEKGEQAWEQRDDIEKLRQAVHAFERAASMEGAGVEPLVRVAHASYWLGEVLPEDGEKQRVQAYQGCYDAAVKAMAMDETSPGANLWATVCNGRKAEIKGLLSGSYDLGLAIVCLNVVAREQNDYYYGAIYRYWGRFVYEIPSLGRRIASFSLDDSVFLYEQALKIEPDFFMTRLYLAETYLAKKNKHLAKRELLYILKTPADVVPGAEPENSFYQQKAREFLDKEFP